MPTSPLIFKSRHRVTFSELDPYNHVRTEVYSGYYIDHRLNCLRDQEISRCLMIVACVDKQTNRSMDWPEDARGLFYQDG